MSSLFRQMITRPIPTGAKIFTKNGEKFAKWTSRSGKPTVAKIADGKIRDFSSVWSAKFKDAEGKRVIKSTGCKDETAARSVLAAWEREAELVRSGVISKAEASISNKVRGPIAEHIADYIDHLKAAEVSAQRIANKKRQILKVVADLDITTLADMEREKLVRWLNDAKSSGLSAATRNDYRAAMLSFANWCCSGSRPRLSYNPFSGIPIANESADVRRKRRALTPDELERLLLAARWRPLAEYGRVSMRSLVAAGNPAKRSNWTKGAIRPEILIACAQYASSQASEGTVNKLDKIGRERSLIYKTLILTGLRKGELASLTVGQLFSDRLELSAADEKNRKGSSIPLRPDLAEELNAWAKNRKPSEKLFRVPTGLILILDRDLAAAGIPKTDERGRTVDVHALRHTFGTLLSAGGVAPRTAQAAMRHSSIDLTMNVYTDPKFLDVSAALLTLPDLNSVTASVTPKAGKRR